MDSKALLWSRWQLDTTMLTLTLLVAPFVIIWLVSWLKGRSYKLPPGPRTWPLIGNIPTLMDTTKPAHHIITELAKTYGPIFLLKLGSLNMFYVTDPKLIMEVLKEKDNLFSFRPPQMPNIKYLSYTGYQVSIGPDGDYHSFFRKLLATEMLSRKKLKNFQLLRQEQDLVMQDLLLAAQRKEAINMHNALFTMVLNVTTQLLFGRRLRGEGDPPSEWLHLIPAVTQSFDLILAESIHESLYWLDSLLGTRKKMQTTFKSIDNNLSGILKEHMKALDALSPNELAEYEPKDLMDIVLLQRNGENSKFVSETSVKAVCLDLIIASTDTSVSTMEWALSHLILQPNLLKKVQAELDSVVGKERFFDENDFETESLPYFNAVLKETLRHHAPVPWLLPHSNRKAGKIGGYDIPAESFIHLNVHGLCKSDAFWKDPSMFDPERFLSGTSRSVDAMGSYAELLPFGRGRRMCPGVAYAEKVMTTTLGRIMHAFDLSIPDGQTSINMEEQFGLVVGKRNPLFVSLKTRLPPHLYKSMSWSSLITNQSELEDAKAH